MDWGYNMARELCTCNSPIISINSYIEDKGEHKHLIQEYGCNNPKCDKYKVIRRRSDDII